MENRDIWKFGTILLACVLLVGCNSMPSQPAKTADYSSLGDAKSKLTNNTAFPVADAQEAIIRGNAAIARNDLDKALFEYIRALEVGGPDADLFYQIGRIHLAKGDEKRAALAFSLSLREKPDHTGSMVETGILQLQNREYDAAERFLTQALEAAPASPRVYNALGVIADLRKEYQLAQTRYSKAISLGGNRQPIYLNNLGYSRYLSGDAQGAEEAFNRALRLDSGYKRAWRNLGLVYAKAGRYQEAVEAFAKTEELHRAYNDVGYVAMVAGRYDDAGGFFEEAMRLSPMYYELAGRNAKHLAVLRGKGDMAN